MCRRTEWSLKFLNCNWTNSAPKTGNEERSAVHVRYTFLSEPRGSVWNIKKWCSQHIAVAQDRIYVHFDWPKFLFDPAQRHHLSCIVLRHGWIWWVEKAADLAQMKSRLLIGHFKKIGIYTYKKYTCLSYTIN